MLRRRLSLVIALIILPPLLLAIILSPSFFIPTRPVLAQSGTFYRAINLGGSAVTINGNVWDANTTTTSDFSITGPTTTATCNSGLTLNPSATGDQATMLTCWRQFDTTSNLRMRMNNVPNGLYDVYIYTIQDQNVSTPVAYYIAWQSGQAVYNYQPPSTAGHWVKIDGSFATSVTQNTIDLDFSTNSGSPVATPKIAGIEVYQRSLAATATPTTTSTPTPNSTSGAPTPYRAINLGGSGVTIDGVNFEANSTTTTNFTTNGFQDCNEYLVFSPSATTDQSTMLSCWREHWAHSMAMSAMPSGQYQVTLYAVLSWNDPDVHDVTVTLEGDDHVIAPPTSAGQWATYGPYTVNVTDGTLNLTTTSDNGTVLALAGILVNSGSGGGATATPTRTPTQSPTVTPTQSGGGGGTLYRAINIGGPEKIIGGETWESNLDDESRGSGGSSIASVITLDFSNEGEIQCGSYLVLTPTPSTEAQDDMLKCWRNHWEHNMTMVNVPAGQYSVSVYVLQDYEEPSPDDFDLIVQNSTCLTHNMGSTPGRWWKLDCAATVTGTETLSVRTSGAVINISGLEIRRVFSGPTSTPTSTQTSIPNSVCNISLGTDAYAEAYIDPTWLFLPVADRKTPDIILPVNTTLGVYERLYKGNPNEIRIVRIFYQSTNYWFDSSRGVDPVPPNSTDCNNLIGTDPTPPSFTPPTVTTPLTWQATPSFSFFPLGDPVYPQASNGMPLSVSTSLFITRGCRMFAV